MSMGRGSRPVFNSLTNIALAHPRRIAALTLVFFIVAGIYGGPAAGLLKARNSFQDPSSPSAQEQRVIEQATGAEDGSGVLALVSAPPSSPLIAETARTIAAVPGVARVTVPPVTGAASRHSPLISANGRSSLIAVTLRSADDPNAVVGAIDSALHGRRDVQLGGSDVAGKEITAQATKDLGFAELLAFPLLAILGWLIFRGVAALLPIAVGGVAVLGSFAILRLINEQLSLSSFALNLVIGLGLGLAVDYSLLLVWRFREELSAGADVRAALGRTLATAGRTITFSAATVAAAMLTLTLFPQRFLISMGVGGAATALVAGAAALLVVPALLVLLAGRIGRVQPAREGTGRWYTVAHAVMRRPALVATATTAALLVVAFPTLRVHWAGVDATDLPAGQSARVVSDVLGREFPAQDLNPITLAAHAPASAGPQVLAYAQRLRGVPTVTGGQPPQYLGSDTWKLRLGAAGDPISTQAQRTIERIRTIPAPAQVQVGGTAAAFVDQKAAIASRLPLALSALALVTLSILWLMTASVVLPIKALAMNALTVAAATGVLVFVFQDGRLSGLLDYTGQGGIEQTDFLVLAAIVFALSTDYGVLVMTRIKEARDGGRENREAIAVGLEHSGRVVSASAVLLAVAIGAFATSAVIFLKEIGLGALVAVLIDAFIVRALLVPSLMALLGEWNWWSPRALRRLHERIGLDERWATPPAAVAESGAETTLAVSPGS
jgi:RND superfamily putative drug exporter